MSEHTMKQTEQDAIDAEVAKYEAKAVLCRMHAKLYSAAKTRVDYDAADAAYETGIAAIEEASKAAANLYLELPESQCETCGHVYPKGENGSHQCDIVISGDES